jgi:hypothetical protein
VSETDDRASILESGTVYRMAYGCVRNRLDRAFDSKWIDNRAEPKIRAEVEAGELRLDPWVLGRRLKVEGEHGETIKEAVEDELVARKSRW